MTSLSMRAQNLKTRFFFKNMLNSNYNPIDLRHRIQHGAPRADSRQLELAESHCEVWGTPGSPLKLLYVPGGGFCFGPNDDHRTFVETVGRAVGAECFLLNYRLAPEHPHPAALDDTIDALETLSRDATAIVVIADSAGATLALSALMHLRDRGDHARVIGGVYLSAFTDLALTGLSLVTNARRDPMFSAEALIHKAHHYLQGHNPTDPGISPLWGDCRGLPPSLFQVGSSEVLLDDSARMVERGKAAGSDFRLCVCDHAPHVYPLNPKLPEAGLAREQIVQFIQTLSGNRA